MASPLNTPKIDTQGLQKLEDLNTFIQTQPASIFDGLKAMQIIRLYLLTKEAGYSRFTEWMQTDFEASQEAFRSIKDQNHFGAGGFIKTFEDLLTDPR